MQRNGFGVMLEKQITLPNLHFQSNHINYAATLQWTRSKNHDSELLTGSKLSDTKDNIIIS